MTATMSGGLGPFRANLHGPLPTLSGGGVLLRELTDGDAPSLLEHLGSPAVCRHIAAPPRSVEGFLTFIRWTHAQRTLGRHLCVGIVPSTGEQAVGFIQVWPLDPRFATAEWGFALGSAYWGTGVFVAAAERLLAFLFDDLGVRRLEARSAVRNARGNGVLKKLGATPEGILRGGASSADHVMWSLLAEEWRERRRLADPAGAEGSGDGE